MTDISSVLRAYQMKQAIFVYEPVEQDASFKYYVESHPVAYKDGVPLLLEGKPLSIATINELVKAFAAESEKLMMGIIPQEILFFSRQREIVVWHRPAARRFLYFTESLNIPSGECFCPALLFLANGMKSLKVFALKSNRRPSLKSKLFVAPFYNVNESGGICTGNVKIPKQIPDVPGIIKFWEQFFFNSEFSHLIMNRQIIKSGNLSVFWRKMVKGQQRFPKSELVSHPQFNTLANLFDELGLKGGI